MAISQAAQQAIEKTNTVFSELELSKDSLIHQYKTASFGFAGHFSTEQVNQLRKHALVDHVVKDTYYKAINFTTSVPFINNVISSVSQTTPWGISRVQGPLNGWGKKVWILDTGIDLDHGDLNVDVSNSISFVGYESSADDNHGHGTHVSGIVAAIDNSIDAIGVAAGATVVAIKVCDQSGGCYVADVKAGVEYVASRFSPEDVANMSLGFPASLPGIPDMESSIIAAANSGLKFTVAAGNDSDDANNYSPSRVENQNVWTVSASDINDQFASFSNYSNPPIEFAAPGVNIYSLWKDGSTNTTSGTSMAAPHVAGLLLVSQDGTGSDDVISNDPDGDPDPIVETVLITDISGPTILKSGEQGNWQAQPQFGEGTYSYQWYYREGAYDPWITGSTSSLFSHTFDNTTNYSKNAAVKVEVTSAGETVETIKEVLVQPDCAEGGEIGC